MCAGGVSSEANLEDELGQGEAGQVGGGQGEVRHSGFPDAAVQGRSLGLDELGGSFLNHCKLSSFSLSISSISLYHFSSSLGSRHLASGNFSSLGGLSDGSLSLDHLGSISEEPEEREDVVEAEHLGDGGDQSGALCGGYLKYTGLN